MADELVRKKIELLTAQKAKVDRINELLSGPGGFNEASRKTCKNLEAAITASKRPGYFAYYEQPDHLTAIVRSGEVERLQEQLTHLQRQIDQLNDKIEAVHGARGAVVAAIAGGGGAPDGVTTAASMTRSSSSGSVGPNVQSLKQWFATYGSPTHASGSSTDMYTSFTPDKRVYGGTTHYSAFRSQSSTLKKGRLTR